MIWTITDRSLEGAFEPEKVERQAHSLRQIGELTWVSECAGSIYQDSGGRLLTNLTRTRRVVFRHADGNLYRLARNGGSKNPGYMFRPKGENRYGGQVITTEDPLEVIEAALKDGMSVRCKPIPNGTVRFPPYSLGSLQEYEVGSEIAEALGIPETGAIVEGKGG
ncbi:hypothetical protein [Ruegeria marina]|uniref:hypothetical protein n=1 Tax=Ruegeria marina TaxID=639004 RepID=UPI00115F88F1|nr:hypothetical protein [Ruegeria marina]